MSTAPEGCSVAGDDDDDGDGSSSVTWHRLLLAGRSSSFFNTPEPAEESAPESLLSDATETAGEEEDALNAVLRNEGSTNYDSGNFSFSESSKGKTAASPGSQDLAHERFVQLNTELYQTRTELLTYKYKWNEIRNEVELEWTKKHRRLEDEKSGLQQEVERLQELLRVSEGRGLTGGSSLEILKLQSELDQAKIQLDCKDRANVVLKEKIAEQYCDRESLSLEVRKLGKILLEIKNELSSVRSSEQWFRDELHTCQNVNAKLRESNLQLENRISIEKSNNDRLKLELQQVIRNAEEVERRAIKEKEDLLEKLSLIEASNKLENVSDFVLEETLQKLKDSSEKIKFLTDTNNDYQERTEQLERNLAILQSSLFSQEALTEACKNKQSETISRIATLETENADLKAAREHARQENTQLHLDVARQNFTNRDLDVSIGHLRAQLQVLSINFENTRRALAVKEFAADKLDQDNRELRERFVQVERCRKDLQRRLSMSEAVAKEQYEQLLANFRTIQSKNLDLELKLGQCAEYNEKFRRSEQVVRQLKQDIGELQERLQRDAAKMSSSSESSIGTSISGSSSDNSREEASEDAKNSNTCQKHGQSLPEDDTRELKILLKVIESEHRQKLKRYELNNRTLLRKVKEHERARKVAEQQVESLEKEVCRISSMECELAGMREKTMLLEADLESAVGERDTLKGEKLRLAMALQNNCLVQVDEDIWSSFQRIFADLRDKQHVSKENQRFKELLQISERKIQQLEEELKQSLSSSEEKSTVIENLKLEGEIQRVESDEIRSELTVKRFQLEDSQRILTEISSERNSLQDSIGTRQLEESKLRDQIDELQKKLQICVVQLETAYARLQLYEESERVLEESRHRFFNDVQILRDEIIAEKQEKQALQDAVAELKTELVRMVECNLKSDHIASDQTDNSVASVPSLESSGGDSTAPAAARFDEESLKALVSECSRRSSVRPLQECVASLRAEMHQLNSVVRQNGNQRYHVVSLMEELQDATNGTYNSR
ncbi:spindle pole body component 110 [Culex quinquefasciatus]|uniref:spindle pole body component 110 n=1 Tax=Culex quinquefasciatus TaxID=7176 RepID=UPI0018E349B9|nr:spindle pole body component 110 [Culex quinquefasciatus]